MTSGLLNLLMLGPPNQESARVFMTSCTSGDESGFADYMDNDGESLLFEGKEDGGGRPRI